MRTPIAVLAVILALFLVPACGDSESEYDAGPTTTQTPEDDIPKVPSRTLTDAQAKQLLQTRCTQCHVNNRIRGYKRPYVDWVRQLREGKCNEAMMSPLDRLALAHWLSRKYGTGR